LERGRAVAGPAGSGHGGPHRRGRRACRDLGRADDSKAGDPDPDRAPVTRRGIVANAHTIGMLASIRLVAWPAHAVKAEQRALSQILRRHVWALTTVGPVTCAQIHQT